MNELENVFSRTRGIGAVTIWETLQIDVIYTTGEYKIGFSK